MTRDQFISEYGDELAGLLVAAIGEASLPRDTILDEQAAVRGRFIIGQLHKARKLLNRMYDDLQPKPAPNGTAPTQQKAATK